MAASRDPRSMSSDYEYYYRRTLSVREIIPAVAVGVGVGLAAFYVAHLLFQRTPLRPEGRPKASRPGPSRSHRSAVADRR